MNPTQAPPNLRFIAILCTLLSVGCSWGSASPASDSQGAHLTVQNRAWFDVSVIAERGSHRERLGLVPSMSDRDFPISRQFTAPGAGTVLVADPVGQEEVYRSPTIRVVAGSEVFWTLKTQLAQSSVRVR